MSCLYIILQCCIPNCSGDLSSIECPYTWPIQSLGAFTWFFIHAIDIQCDTVLTLKKVCAIVSFYMLTLTVLVTTIDAQWEGMGDVGSARYEPALLPPCPTIRVLSYRNSAL